MAKIKQIFLSISLLCFWLGLCWGINHFLFSEKLNNLKEEFDGKKKILNHYHQLLERKSELDHQHQNLKKTSGDSIQGEQALNDWVREIVKKSTKENLLVEKIEPFRTKKENREILGINLLFQGNILHFFRLLYFLSDTSRSVSVHMFSIKKQDETHNFQFELNLHKEVL